MFLRYWLWLSLMIAPFHAAPAADRPQWIATTAMVGDLLTALAGDQLAVTVLLSSGIDPHTYRLTRQDAVALSQADGIVYNGGLLEGRMTDTLTRLADQKPVIAVGDTVPPEQRLASEDYPGEYDPHLWMDVGRWRLALAGLETALAAVYPEHAAAFAANRARYDDQLAQLDGYIRDIVATLPADRRVLITAHDAFRYFADAYGFEVHGVQGVSTESEANLQQVNELIELIVARRIPAVFAETSVNARQVQALIEGATARGQPVTLGAPLFSDAMGPAEEYTGTYLGMLDHNATAIVRALGGDAPALGWQQRLQGLP